MRRMLVALLLLAAPLSGAAAGVGPIEANDTGGIIPYASADRDGARELALAHCARYDKLPKATGVDPQYGGYYSFACEWDRRGPR